MGSCDKISIKRECQWCGKEFEVKSLFSRDKYCDEHKKEAAKSNVLKAKVAYYKRNKRAINIKMLGTTSIGVNPSLCEPLFYLGVKIPFSEFAKEQILIQKECKRNNGIPTIYKKGITNNNVWIDNSHTLEYGEPQPSGIQNTHKYATFDDYYHTAKHHLLSDRGKCPECGCPDHYKTDKDVSCAFCGLILETNPKLMGWTDKDISESQITKTTVQSIAWNKYWVGK
jgi:hypothetical protein